jgi:translation initiation factor 1 (eIF-1/SUI1)
MSNQQEILNEILNEIDKKIYIRILKEGKATRTYIEGLSTFYTDLECKNIGNKIKKNLSTSYFYKEENKSHGYNGDHKLRLKEILQKEYKIQSDKIIMCS